MAAASEAWAATGSWRGDLKLFARIAEKAADEIAERRQPNGRRIEFAVRDDLEVYDSVEELLERVPASTTRGFRSARIQVGGAGLLVEVLFGRKEPESAVLSCDYGVAIKVSSNGAVDAETVRDVRGAVAKVVARGGFARVKPPTEGPTAERTNLAEALLGRWREREAVSQVIFGAITLVVLAITAAVFFLTTSDQTVEGVDWEGLPTFLGLIGAVLGIVQLITLKASTWIFPAIEIADVTPGRRMLKLIGGSGLISAAVSIAAAFGKTLIS